MRLVNVMAASLDGRIASHPGEDDAARAAAGLGNERDLEHLRRLIAGADAVLIGGRTLAASGGVIEAWPEVARRGIDPMSGGSAGRGGTESQVGASGPDSPTWYVLTTSGLSPDLPFWRQHHIPRRLVMPRAPAAPLPDPAVPVDLISGGDWPRDLHALLKSRGVERALLFGGAEVNRAFYAAGLVDELVLTLFPVLLAAPAAVPLVAPGLPAPTRLTLADSEKDGDLIFLRYLVTPA